ncbi:hypothetical protein DH2020_019359 [Rehmannia glutinosa]|uniref:DUF4283 domain-containing protein n=1 Tax=Rehmannia glutinosa TaxID=99300 RepID=A0ABR0WLT1_REHGL
MAADLESKLRSFSLSDSEKSELVIVESDISSSLEECQRSLFGRIFGSKRANFFGLKTTFSNIWPVSHSFSVKEIGFNFFQFIFSSKDDSKKVLRGKTWSFDNQYIVLKEWSESLDFSPSLFKDIEMWIQVWNLPVHWLCSDVGLKIGKTFSKVSDVCIPESGSARGRCIKLLVLVDLEKPLPRGKHIKLGDSTIWLDFKYENLLNLCSYCGLIGHPIKFVINESLILNKIASVKANMVTAQSQPLSFPSP